LKLSEIKEKLEEALQDKNWELVVEVIGDIELEETYTSPYDDSDEETWG
jgi:hypothetical protein|tara:strand:+ start:515 stop:661 length:147 start_codon:yes stop_codon:yes gene_type:complete